MSTNTVTAPPAETALSRRGFFMKLGILFNGFAAIVLALPVARFLFSSITHGRGNGYLSWVPLGNVSNFPEGETRMATFRNPLVMPTDGKTVDTACWVRRIAADQFQVFAINCARLGCRSVGSSNIHTKSKTVCSRSTLVSCQLLATRWQV